MADPIEAHYAPDGDDWTVAVTGRGRTLTGRAPGLIAARDKADQLVEQLTTDESGRKTVVHLLNGDAVEFTTAYLTARLARTDEPAPIETPEATADRPAEEAEAGQDGGGSPAGEQEAPAAGPATGSAAGTGETDATNADGPAAEADSAGEAEANGPVGLAKWAGRRGQSSEDGPAPAHRSQDNEPADEAEPGGPRGAVGPSGESTSVPAPSAAAEGKLPVRRPSPTPRPRTESQAVQPAEETAPSGG